MNTRTEAATMRRHNFFPILKSWWIARIATASVSSHRGEHSYVGGMNILKPQCRTLNFFGQTIKNQNSFYLPAGDGKVGL